MTDSAWAVVCANGKLHFLDRTEDGSKRMLRQVRVYEENAALDRIPHCGPHLSVAFVPEEPALLHFIRWAENMADDGLLTDAQVRRFLKERAVELLFHFDAANRPPETPKPAPEAKEEESR